MGLRENSQSKKKIEITSEKRVEAGYQPARHYHDGDVELDAIERLRSNLMMLDDLEQRLRFMNNELESIIGTKLKS